MSISAATNVAFSRRSDNSISNPSTLPAVESATGGPPESKNAVTSALSAIATYIPSEILTLYVSVLAALGTTGSTGDTIAAYGNNAAWIAFWFFLVATPTVVWVLYATKVKTAGKPLPIKLSEWPVWEMSSATIAYMAWAFAMPSSPFLEFASWYSPPIAGILVLVVSAGLGLVAPLFTQRPL
jgi:hypothetical protein